MNTPAERVRQFIEQGFDQTFHDKEGRSIEVRCSHCAVFVVKNVPHHEEHCPQRKKPHEES